MFTDFENLNRIYKENKENKKIFFYSKSFLSFSHNNKKADYFLNKDKNTCPPYLLLCKFILHESEKINNKWPSAFNIDVKSNSKFGSKLIPLNPRNNKAFKLFISLKI